MATSKAVKTVRERGTTVLAWLSFLIAFTGGAYASAMFLGSIVRTLIGWVPNSIGPVTDIGVWLPGLLLLAAVIGTGIDIFLDGVPNQFAVYSAIAAPTLASAVGGKLGDNVTKWAHTMQGHVGSGVVEWTGTASTVGLAILCIAASLLMAKRVIKKSAGSGAGAGARPTVMVR